MTALGQEDEASGCVDFLGGAALLRGDSGGGATGERVVVCGGWGGGGGACGGIGWCDGEGNRGMSSVSLGALAFGDGGGVVVIPTSSRQSRHFLHSLHVPPSPPPPPPSILRTMF